jgi:anti-sigma B factor antagonist/stage II sporulation protein AA (anti-sigma F factor antagonist)
MRRLTSVRADSTPKLRLTKSRRLRPVEAGRRDGLRVASAPEVSPYYALSGPDRELVRQPWIDISWSPDEVAFVEIGVQRRGNVLVLSPVGRLDNDTSPTFQARLLDSVGPSGAAVLLDFSGVEYISSAGLRALMMASKQSKAANGRLAVAGLKPVVKEIFAISRFSYVVQIFETPAEAIAALS